MIYSFAFPQRVLTIHVTGIRNSRGLPNFVFNVTGHPKARDLSLHDRRARLSRLVRLSVDMRTWPALALSSVCHESRDFLYPAGYQTWHLPDIDGVMREIAWNPGYDTVALVGPYTDDISSSYTEILSILHPDEAKIVRQLVLPSSSWGSRRAGTDEGEEKGSSRWLTFESLREIIVVIDEIWESRFVRRLPSALNDFWTFEIPGDIENGLKNLQETTAWGDRSVPRVRVVKEGAGIFGENVETRLRCFPCPDLKILETS